MNASDILRSWNRVAKAFGYRSSAWLKMLRIVEAGEKGITIKDLCGLGSSVKGHWRWINKAKDAGLVEIIPNAVPHARGGMPACLVRITPKGVRAIMGAEES